MRMMRGTILVWSAAILVASAGPSYRNNRSPAALPDVLYRDNVEPNKGGKVPEAAHMRIEINKLDAAGLQSEEGILMLQELMEAAPSLPDSMTHHSEPGFSPPLKLKPDYVPAHQPSSYSPSGPYQPYEPEPYSPPGYGAPKPYAPAGYETPAPYQPSSYESPEPSYGAPSYGAPEPYAPPKPVGPVLLEKRPYEVHSVQALPVTVGQSYTNFDCRSVPYPDRHYADIESGCEIYHFCHADGKQDTFHCGYGTIFNEYIGTCDYKNSVKCAKGEGYAAPHKPYAPAPHKVHAPAPAHGYPHHQPAYPHTNHYGF